MRLTCKGLALLMLLGLSAGAQAQSKTLHATIPWEGEGRVFVVGPSKLLFLGAFDGIMYIATSEGEMNEAFVECPLSQHLDMESGVSTAQGYCEIVADGETVFAQWDCTGRIGFCQGNFQLTGGTGQFEGITGSSSLIVRSPLGALASDASNDVVIRVAAGLAVLPKLTYELRQ